MNKNQLAVAEALTWLGTPYHHQGRVKGVGVDCRSIQHGSHKPLRKVKFFNFKAPSGAFLLPILRGAQCPTTICLIRRQ